MPWESFRNCRNPIRSVPPRKRFSFQWGKLKKSGGICIQMFWFCHKFTFSGRKLIILRDIVLVQKQVTFFSKIFRGEVVWYFNAECSFYSESFCLSQSHNSIMHLNKLHRTLKCMQSGMKLTYTIFCLTKLQFQYSFQSSLIIQHYRDYGFIKKKMYV